MMIYRFELRRQIFNTVIWTVIVTGVLWLMLYGFYPLFLSSRPVMEEMLSAFPPETIAALGFNLDDLFGFQSFSGMVYLYEGILAGIMASGTAITIFSREKRNKCLDFLFAKPQKRSDIFLQKLLCCLTLVGILNIVYAAGFLASYFDYTGADTLTFSALLSVLCLFFTQLVFISIGIFVAVFLRRVRSASGLGAGIGIFAFLMSVVYSLTEKEFLKYISPLYYFNPATVSETGGYDASCVVTAIILILGLVAVAYIKFTTDDIET